MRLPHGVQAAFQLHVQVAAACACEGSSTSCRLMRRTNSGEVQGSETQWSTLDRSTQHAPAAEINLPWLVLLLLMQSLGCFKLSQHTATHRLIHPTHINGCSKGGRLHRTQHTHLPRSVDGPQGHFSAVNSLLGPGQHKEGCTEASQLCTQ